jgi:sugar O-acyltransferase (sialic acid O-acetyltransferase NeuD family)
MAGARKQVVVWGSSGQAKVAMAMFGEDGYDVACFCDIDPDVDSLVDGVPIFHRQVDFATWLSRDGGTELSFVAAIGGARGPDRLAVHSYLCDLGLRPLSLVHKSAFVDVSVALGEGSQVCAMAALSLDIRVGKQCIFNTNSTVDHECIVGDGVHVMPGATVAGLVEIGSHATIGTNATVLPRLRVGDGAFVGAGAVVTKDVPPNAVVVGVPARVMKVAAPPAIGSDPWLVIDQVSP